MSQLLQPRVVGAAALAAIQHVSQAHEVSPIKSRALSEQFHPGPILGQEWQQRFQFCSAAEGTGSRVKHHLIEDTRGILYKASIRCTGQSGQHGHVNFQPAQQVGQPGVLFLRQTQVNLSTFQVGQLASTQVLPRGAHQGL